MGEVNVTPASLLQTADAYNALATRATLIFPQAVTEIQRVIESHGPIGYPTAVGITAGLAVREGPLNAKINDFATYSQRFTEHAATYAREDNRAATRLKNIPWPASLREFVPTSHVDPKPPPPRPLSGWCCWIVTENGDVANLCPSDTDRVTYVDKDGNLVMKILDTGEITVLFHPGCDDGYDTCCWLPSADADRSICNPQTTTWMYPKNGFMITETKGPDGKNHIIEQRPPG